MSWYLFSGKYWFGGFLTTELSKFKHVFLPCFFTDYTLGFVQLFRKKGGAVSVLKFLLGSSDFTNKLASFFHELAYQQMQLAYQLMQLVHAEKKTALVTKLHFFFLFGPPPASAVPII